MKAIRIGALLAALAMSCACGYSSKNYTTPPNAMPAIAQLNPESATSGGAGFTLTVNGSNFAAHAVINWNGVAMTTGYVSASQLTAVVPAASIAASGTVPITVTNPAISGGGIYGNGGTPAVTSAAVNFTVN